MTFWQRPVWRALGAPRSWTTWRCLQSSTSCGWCSEREVNTSHLRKLHDAAGSSGLVRELLALCRGGQPE
eukprot:4214758-Alexandrium_andersonii.AAC.1